MRRHCWMPALSPCSPGGSRNCTRTVCWIPRLLTTFSSSRTPLLLPHTSRATTLCRRKTPLPGDPSRPRRLVEQLATSKRSRQAISNALEDNLPIRIYFMPWDDAMDMQREYRVFCAPTSAYNPRPSRVTAVSQYVWHKPSALADLSHPQIEAEMEHLLEGIVLINAEIMAYSLENGMNERLKREGSVFDVFVRTATREVQLLELNSFGVIGNCGSCPFNWVADAETLYGGKDEIEVCLAI
ncbi:hypothetical protein DFH08DRAFT_854787 [Mycena albidolilacea]|uniref:Cell division cycle protein 123 n=1 Tax=Mycena albidolilacea TaxID=1033008 RepID=A0AAD7EXF0_9AGAR|nr:hypothetical protein DFH08DRAFT_854787 [Mycena albidolilacea]